MIKLLLPSALEYEFAFDLMKENMKKYYDLYDIALLQSDCRLMRAMCALRFKRMIGFVRAQEKHHKGMRL